MEIILCIGELSDGDAIGYDAMEEGKILLSKGFSVYFYTDNWKTKENLPTLNDSELFNKIQVSENILIYHHAVYWKKFEQILEKIQCKLILKYHNITPSQFYQPFHPIIEQITKQGVQQLNQIIGSQKVCSYISASTYNTKDLLDQNVSLDKITVQFPFYKQFQPNSINPKLENQFHDNTIYLLFVGRTVPNKGHIHLIQTVYTYKKIFGQNIVLNIIGSMSPVLSIYNKYLLDTIKENDLSSNIFFQGKVSEEDLYTYYKKSNLFLLLSEHEGFCVPILEAQFYQLPILAYNSTAIQDTIGQNQLLFDQLDYIKIASAIHLIYTKKEYRDFLIENATKNISRFDNIKQSEEFIRYIEKLR